MGRTMGMSENNKRFDKCRERLWKLLADTAMSEGCKSYEGTIELSVIFPNFFDSPDELPDPYSVGIHLDCYVLGPARHYDFRANTFCNAIRLFEKWLDKRENEMKEEVQEDG